jgi:PST family polysaccharide transporter
MQSISWLLTEKLLMLALSFAVTIAVARHLMPEAFGQLSFYIALVSLAAPMMALGLNSLVIREVLLRPSESGVIVGSALLLRVLSGLLVATAGSALAFSILPQKEALLVAILLLSSICNASLVFDFWFQAHMANGYAVLLRLGVFFFI